MPMARSLSKFEGVVRNNFIQIASRNLSTDSERTKWEGIVGLEVHAQLQTNSKLFSAAGTSFTEGVNNQVSFFDAAIPGTLPVLNKECIRKGITSALALNCTIHPISWFDRKHYFYADLPAGYQITQQRAPFATDGALEFEVIDSKNMSNSYLKKSRIKQIQLEQDSGKSLHDASGNLSLVDLNRAGNPLIEIVFEPDLHNGEEAACLVEELILILRKLEACSCKIEEGALRVDANISVRMVGDEILGIRSEVKNIGGIRNICKAIDFEINRQKKLRIAGKSVMNETRSWDADNGYTVAMRDKEIEQDYRFMPEPNLPPLRISLEDDDSPNGVSVSSLRKNLPELPAVTRQNLKDEYGFSVVTVIRLLNEPVLLNHFTFIMKANGNRDPVKVCNFLLIDLIHSLNKHKISAEECKANSTSLGQLIDLLHNGVVNRIMAFKVIDELISGCEQSPLEMIEKNQWFQINDETIIKESVKLAIEFNPELVEDYRKAKKKYKSEYLQKIFYEVLENTDNRVNMILAKEILQKALDDLK